MSIDPKTYVVPEGKALVLRVCHAGRTSDGQDGRPKFQWPAVGDVVTAPDWDPTPECGHGLHGWLWGVGSVEDAGASWAFCEMGATWLVVETGASAVVSLSNGQKCKYPSGRVVFEGPGQDAALFVQTRAPNGSAVILGTATAGYGGTATAGERGTATAGSYGTATAGHGGTATAGYGGTATAGHRGTALAGEYGTATAGHHGTATAGYGGTATAGGARHRHRGELRHRHRGVRRHRHRGERRHRHRGGARHRHRGGPQHPSDPKVGLGARSVLPRDGLRRDRRDPPRRPVRARREWEARAEGGPVSREEHVPSDSRIFVFGSNLRGQHAGGAARYAREQLGAEWSVGRGRTGRCYALPTCRAPGVPLSLDDVAVEARLFKAHALLHPQDRFYVTAVGCGIAGFSEEDVAPLFAGAPGNCDLPDGWRR